MVILVTTFRHGKYKVKEVKNGGNTLLIETHASKLWILAMSVRKKMFSKHVFRTILPELCVEQENLVINADALQQYRDICGYPIEQKGIPITFLHSIVFPLEIIILLDERLPFHGCGIIPISKHFQQFGSITIDMNIKVRSKLEKTMIPHSLGYCFVITSDIFSPNDSLLWKCSSIYLYPTRVFSSNIPIYSFTISSDEMTGTQEINCKVITRSFAKRASTVCNDISCSLYDDYPCLHSMCLRGSKEGSNSPAVTHLWYMSWCLSVMNINIREEDVTLETGMHPNMEVFVELPLPMHFPMSSHSSSATLTAHAFAKSVSAESSRSKNRSLCKSHKMFEVCSLENGLRKPMCHMRGWCAWN